MSDTAMLTLSLAAGALLGALFFAGLWWTLRTALETRRAALWILLSSQIRTVAVVTGFYFIGRGDWQRLVAAVAGFFIARMVIAIWPSKAALAPNEESC